MRRPFLAALIAAALATSGCGAVDTLVQRVSPVDELGTPTVTIAVLAPLTGGEARTGRSLVQAVEQAAADSGGVAGWDVVVAPYDLATEDVEPVLDELSSDDTTVAVITGFSAQDVRAVVPELDDIGLAVMSPADTDPRHVRGADPGAPLRPWSGYQTLAVESAPEQTALAEHLVQVSRVTSAVVVSDGSDEADVRTVALVQSLEQRGVSQATPVTWTGSLEAESLGEALAALGPGAALVVDADPGVASSLAAVRAEGTVLALSTQPAQLGESDAAALEGALAPTPGEDPDRGEDQLGAALEAGGRPSAVGPYGPAAYDAGRLFVDVFTRCLPDPESSSSPSRSACRAEAAGATWTGLTGPIQFDEYGARLGQLPGVVALRAGQWAAPGG